MRRIIVLFLLGLISLGLVSCASVPRDMPSRHLTLPQGMAVSQARNHLVAHSFLILGAPYRFGGQDLTSGFDCSGMVGYVYRQALGVSLPRTAAAMAQAGREIHQQDLRPGDLVFFNTTGQKFSHVGIYLGQGLFMHAPNHRSTIRQDRLDNRYYRTHFSGARSFF